MNYPNKTRSWALLVCAAVIALSAIPAQAVDYSSWLKNISAAGDTEALYVHSNVKIAISGTYVHFAWLGTLKDFSGHALFYTRSADGGLTFETPKILATDVSSDFFKVEFPPDYNNLAADGQYVHILYTVGWPNKLQYLRSTDNGATFAAPYTMSSGYLAHAGYLAATTGKLAVIYSANGDDSPYPRRLYCAYSSDNGATFNTTTMLTSDGGIYRYTVVDAVRSGDYLYALSQTQDINYTGSEVHMYLWASWDGGATFKPAVKVTLPSTDTKDYASKVQDAQYTPNLHASAATVNIVWLNYDISPYDSAYVATLRTRRSTDGGVTLGDSVTLHTFPAGGAGVHQGLETITGSGDNLYITDVLGDGAYVFRSTDAGATWGTGLQISTGGWWPITKIDPADTTKIHTVHSAYFLSKDGGATFNGGVNPHYPFGAWDSPQMTVDAGGVVHYAGSYGGGYEGEIFYRRIAAPPEPGSTDKCLSLTSGAATTRSDNMQVPATDGLQPTSALTVEFWFKFNTFINSTYLQEIVFKNKLSGFSYHIGVWSNTTPYCTLTTDVTTGAWAGTGIIIANDTWTHLAMTYDSTLTSGNLKLYVNGIPSGSADVTGNILYDKMDCPIQIGHTDRNDNVVVNVDEVRIWNTARSEADIAANMDNELTGTETGLVAYYNLNDTTKDITGHGNNGMLMFQETYVEPGVKPPYVPPTTTTTISTSTTTEPTSTTTIEPTTTTTAMTSTTSIYSTTTSIEGGTTTTTTANPCPATTALGKNSSQLDNLRDFRDSSLARSAFGRRVIQIYYSNADGINAALERSPALKAVTRRALAIFAPMMGR
jgi:hypothetical protein